MLTEPLSPYAYAQRSPKRRDKMSWRRPIRCTDCGKIHADPHEPGCPRCGLPLKGHTPEECIGPVKPATREQIEEQRR